MHPYHLVMLGCPVSREFFPGETWDPEWQPYTNGQMELAIIDQQTEWIYAGKVYGLPIFASSSQDTGHRYINSPTEEDRAMVKEFLERLNCKAPPRLMILTLWM